MRIVSAVLLLLLIGGCGAGGGGAATEPGTVIIGISIQAPTASDIIYALEFTVELPAGVTVQADPTTREVANGVLKVPFSNGLADARYEPGTATDRGKVKVNIASPSGFMPGEIAVITCTASGADLSAANFTVDGFSAKDQNGATMPDISPLLTERTQ